MALAAFNILSKLNLKSISIFVAAGAAAVTVAYAGYSFGKRGQDSAIQAVRAQMAADMAHERRVWMDALASAASVDAKLSDVMEKLDNTRASITRGMSELKGRYPEVYDLQLPIEGEKVWDTSREMYNSSVQ